MWQSDSFSAAFAASDGALVRVWWSIATGPFDTTRETKGYSNFSAATPPASTFDVPAQCVSTKCAGAQRLPPHAALYHTRAIRMAGFGRRASAASKDIEQMWRRH